MHDSAGAAMYESRLIRAFIIPAIAADIRSSKERGKAIE